MKLHNAVLNKPQWFSVVDCVRTMTHPLNQIKSSGYNRDITRHDRVNRSLSAGSDISIHVCERDELSKYMQHDAEKWFEE